MAAHTIEMDDGVRLRTWGAGPLAADQRPVVMVHGGPGVPDYLAPVSSLIEDLCRVHRYDQRGTGGSEWQGEHTIARHVRDLEALIDAWGYSQVVLLGHSFGTDLATFFLLAHPDRIAGIVYVSGPFLGSWRDADRARQQARRSEAQQARLEELDAVQSRNEDEEIEYLTLSWFTDHADREHAWGWARASAQTLRPVNYAMNAQLNEDKRVDPLESHVDYLRQRLPAGASIIGGAGDSRPADVLRQVAARLDCEAIIIPCAGHNPWLETPVAFRAALRAVVHRQIHAR